MDKRPTRKPFNSPSPYVDNIFQKVRLPKARPNVNPLLCGAAQKAPGANLSTAAVPTVSAAAPPSAPVTPPTAPARALSPALGVSLAHAIRGKRHIEVNEQNGTIRLKYSAARGTAPTSTTAPAAASTPAATIDPMVTNGPPKPPSIPNFLEDEELLKTSVKWPANSRTLHEASINDVFKKLQETDVESKVSNASLLHNYVTISAEQLNEKLNEKFARVSDKIDAETALRLRNMALAAHAEIHKRIAAANAAAAPAAAPSPTAASPTALSGEDLLRQLAANRLLNPDSDAARAAFAASNPVAAAEEALRRVKEARPDISETAQIATAISNSAWEAAVNNNLAVVRVLLEKIAPEKRAEALDAINTSMPKRRGEGKSVIADLRREFGLPAGAGPAAAAAAAAAPTAAPTLGRGQRIEKAYREGSRSEAERIFIEEMNDERQTRLIVKMGRVSADLAQWLADVQSKKPLLLTFGAAVEEAIEGNAATLDALMPRIEEMLRTFGRKYAEELSDAMAEKIAAADSEANAAGFFDSYDEDMQQSIVAAAKRKKLFESNKTRFGDVVPRPAAVEIPAGGSQDPAVEAAVAHNVKLIVEHSDLDALAKVNAFLTLHPGGPDPGGGLAGLQSSIASLPEGDKKRAWSAWLAAYGRLPDGTPFSFPVGYGPVAAAAAAGGTGGGAAGTGGPPRGAGGAPIIPGAPPALFTPEQVRAFVVEFRKASGDPAKQKLLAANIELVDAARAYIKIRSDATAPTSPTPDAIMHAAWLTTSGELDIALGAIATSGAPGAPPTLEQTKAFVIKFRAASGNPEEQRKLVSDLEMVRAAQDYIDRQISAAPDPDETIAWIKTDRELREAINPPAPAMTPTGAAMARGMALSSAEMQKGPIGKFLNWYANNFWARVGAGAIIGGAVGAGLVATGIVTGGLSTAIFVGMFRGAGGAAGSWLAAKNLPPEWFYTRLLTSIAAGVFVGGVSGMYAQQLLENSAMTAQMATELHNAKLEAANATTAAANAKLSAGPSFIPGYGIDSPPQLRLAIGELTTDIENFLDQSLPPSIMREALAADTLLDKADALLSRGDFRGAQALYDRAEGMFERADQLAAQLDKLAPISPDRVALSTPPYAPEAVGYSTGPFVPPLEHGGQSYFIGDASGTSANGMTTIRNINDAVLHEFNMADTPLNDVLWKLTPNLQGSFAQVFDRTLEQNPDFMKLLFNDASAESWGLTGLPKGASFNFGNLLSNEDFVREFQRILMERTSSGGFQYRSLIDGMGGVHNADMMLKDLAIEYGAGSAPTLRP